MVSTFSGFPLRFRKGFIAQGVVPALILFSATGATQAQLSVEPLKSFVARIDSKKPDPANLAYVGARCGVLFDYLIDYLQSKGESSGSPMIVRLRNKTTSFSLASVLGTMAADKTSQDSIPVHEVALKEYYSRQIAEIRRTNSIELTAEIRDDFTVCINRP